MPHSISHDEGWTVEAHSDGPVGVDVERKKYIPAVARRRFTEDEQKLLMCAQDKEKVFTEIWTAKEAYVKMIGVGIPYGLKKVDTTKLDNIHYVYFGDFVVAVCAGGRQ